MRTLRRRVSHGLIEQEPGIGGCWPVATDHLIWAIAAYEVYNVTGNHKWLHEIYPIIKATLNKDLHYLWEPYFELIHGETSHPTVSEGIYPTWMTTTDIYSSMSLNTNAIFIATLRLMGTISEILNQDGAEYAALESKLSASLNNNLWMPSAGYYSEYLYGVANPIQSSTTDNLGQTLAILLGIANREMALSILTSTPIRPQGIAYTYPLRRDIQSIEEQESSPFMQTMWLLSAAKVKHMQALNFALSALYHRAATHGTYTIIPEATTSDNSRIGINALNCSAATAIAMRLYAGITFTPDSISFAPVIPSLLSGVKTITNFHYRNSNLTISITGTGSKIKSFAIDGITSHQHSFAGELHGDHTISIVMANDTPEPHTLTQITEPQFIAKSPSLSWTDSTTAKIDNIIQGLEYKTYINGEITDNAITDTYVVTDTANYHNIAIAPLNGYTCKPLEYLTQSAISTIEAELLAIKGTRHIKDKKLSKTFTELTIWKNTRIRFSYRAKNDGIYFVDVRYANGNGPNGPCRKSVIRALLADEQYIGDIIMPQLGDNDWTTTAFSNRIRVHLTPGIHIFTIEYKPLRNEPIDFASSSALLDYVRITRQ
jgi:hypothetical protein